MNLVKLVGRRKKVDQERFLRAKERLYNLSRDELLQLFADSDGSCDICGHNSRRLFIDHNHKTGTVRGLLCSGCNAGLGHFHDDVTLLSSAVNYLNSYI